MAKKREEGEPLENDEDLVKALIDCLNKENKIAYSLASSSSPVEVKTFVPTGSSLLDFVLANKKDGGVPVGRIIEINGIQGSGKSLIASHIAANAQKAGGVVIYADTENAVSIDFMKRLQVDLEKLVYIQPSSVEETFESAEKVILKTRETLKNKDKPVVFIWDSVAATPVKTEIEGTYDANSRMGVAAKTMSLAMRKLTQTIGYEKVTCVFINQLRQRFNAPPYSDPWVTPYGMAIPFHASVRIRLTPGGMIKNGEEIIGVACKAKVVKNKIGPPFRTVNFNIMFDYGIDDEQSWYDLLHEKGDIRKAASWSYLTLNGKEHKFQHSGWRELVKDKVNKDAIFTIIEKYLVKDYSEKDLTPENIVLENLES